MKESVEKTIDIKRILKDKMGSKARFVPCFLVAWLKKIKSIAFFGRIVT